MIIQTPAIVLRCVDFQESSRIATLFTRSAGKVTVLARSSKKAGNKFSGLIEPGHILDVIFSEKGNRSIQTLNDASFKIMTWELRTGFNKLGLCMSTIELLDQVLHEHELNEDLYDFSESFIAWLASQKDDLNPSKIFPYLQIRIIELIGIGLQFLPMGTEKSNNWFINVTEGTVSQNSGLGLCFRLNSTQFDYVIRSLKSRNSSVFNTVMTDNELKELVIHLDTYLRHHVGGMRERRSDIIMNQIFGGIS